jgi:hypothetical protein
MSEITVFEIPVNQARRNDLIVDADGVIHATVNFFDDAACALRATLNNKTLWSWHLKDAWLAPGRTTLPVQSALRAIAEKSGAPISGSILTVVREI